MNHIHSIEREEKSFGCTKESSNSEYCQEFYLFKESIDEFGGGSSQCVEESSNGQYCYRWTLRKEEYRKCWIYNYIDDDRTLVTAVACCANGATSGCCQKLCDTSFYNAYPPEIEYGDCHCTAESANGQYCESWYCEEFYYPSQTYGQNRERLYYDCAEESVSGEFCEGWKTRMDSVKKFEVSNCACDEPHVDDASGVMKYCAKWSCQEHQVEYYWPNMGWALFSAIFGLVPVAVALVGMFYAEKTQDWIWWYLGLSVVWGGGFAFIGVWKAGLGVLFTTFIPMHGLVLLIMMYRYSNKEKIASCFQGLYNVPTRFFGANVQESKEDLEKAEQNSDVGSTSSEPVAVAQPVPIKQDAESMVLEDRIRNLRDQMNSGEISRSRYHVLVTSAVEELYL